MKKDHAVFANKLAALEEKKAEGKKKRLALWTIKVPKKKPKSLVDPKVKVKVKFCYRKKKSLKVPFLNRIYLPPPGTSKKKGRTFF